MRRLPPFALFALFAFIVAATGCSDDPSSSTAADAGDPDANVDTGGPDASADAPDDGSTDGTDDVGATTPAEPPVFDPGPAQSSAEWTPLALDWLVGIADLERGDNTDDDIELGRFSFPSLGGGPHGVQWSEAAFDESGNQITNGASSIVYMAARFDVDETTHLIVQPDRSYRAWVNGVRRPGDIYGSGAHRVAWTLAPGTHELVIQFEGRRGAPRVRTWTTPDPMTFHAGDRTWPHLVDGSDDVQWLGMPVLVFGDTPLAPVRARVVGSEYWEETEVLIPGIGAGSTTQVPFELRPTAPWTYTAPATDEDPAPSVPVTLRFESADLSASYDLTIDLEIVPADRTYRRTFRSAVDGSAQYYGVVPPSDFDPERDYGIVLSLHGAGVQALGQARAYSAKDWGYVVAATNRRPFGFDWEVFGRLDGLEVLADAQRSFRDDPTRVHVTGHSMGGHGTWQLGTLFPTLFATVGPSAGWSSFYSYTGETRPQGVFARSQASSTTNNYVANLTDRAVFVIHGDADDNVPVREARDMVSLLTPFVDDLQYHEQPGAGHWWNGDRAAGADCVDWPELFETMADRRLDPYELDFEFISPSPWVSPRHSFVTVETVESPMDDFTVAARQDADTVMLTTTNVARAALDLAPLREAGVSTLFWNGEAVALDGDVVHVGAETAKRVGVAGPFNTVLHAPFCFVYEAAGPEIYAEVAAYMTANWAVIGNGFACTLALEEVTEWERENYNLLYLGVPPQSVDWEGPVDFRLLGDSIGVEDADATYDFDRAAIATAYPAHGRLGGLMLAADGYEYLLFRYSPFQSRFVLPDFMVWSDAGVQATGYYDNDWALAPSFSQGL